MGGAHRETTVRDVSPIVLYDHDGFASDGIDGEPSVRWPKKFLAVKPHKLLDTPTSRRNIKEWNGLMQWGGPPLYGVQEEG